MAAELEFVVNELFKTGRFTQEGIDLDAEDYQREDGLYYLAAHLEEARKKRAVINNKKISAYRIYELLTNEQRSCFSRPFLSFEAYFCMTRLLEDNKGEYFGEEGYIQLARDLRAQANCKANLGMIWVEAKNLREKLQWGTKINLSLSVFEKMDELIAEDQARYSGEEGYIQLAKDVKKETGRKIELPRIWAAAKKYRTNPLNWPLQINTPLIVFEKMDELVKENPLRYMYEEGYIQLAEDLGDATGCKIHLRLIWSGAAQYREQLQWPNKIDRELDIYVEHKGWIRYHGELRNKDALKPASDTL